MKDIVKKSFLLGLGAASLSRKRAEKIVKQLVSKNAMTVKESRAMLKRIGKAADSERKRIKKFAQKEVSRVASKVGILSKPHIENVKKRLKSIDKGLSSRGKKTLRGVLKQLSR